MRERALSKLTDAMGRGLKVVCLLMGVGTMVSYVGEVKCGMESWDVQIAGLSEAVPIR